MDPNRKPSERKPTVLQRLIQKHMGGFLAEMKAEGHEVPAFIEETLRAFLDCGVLDKGCLHLKCLHCGHEEFVPYSCKLRGVCARCTRRVANDVSKRLTRLVLPEVAYRHWVVSYPFEVSKKVGYQPKLISAVERLLLKVLRAWAEARGGKCMTGGVLIRHRFGANLNLQLHCHIVMMDGCYTENEAGQLVFVPGGDIGQEELNQLGARLHRRMHGLLKRRGIAMGDANAPSESDKTEQPANGMAARSQGLHLFVSQPMSEREKLEELFKYLLRCGVDASRLRELPDGRYAYRLSRKDAQGNRDLVLTGPKMLKRLASLIPTAKMPTRRYFGVLAAGAKWREDIVPWLGVLAKLRGGRGGIAQRGGTGLDWADLLKRVFGNDAFVCRVCKMRMTVVRQLGPGEYSQMRRTADGWARVPLGDTKAA